MVMAIIIIIIMLFDSKIQLTNIKVVNIKREKKYL
jgi:hypothetical protein